VTTFLLIPGAGGDARSWSRLVPRLQERGHDAIAVDLPAQDESAGWAEHAQVAITALGRADPRTTVVVAHSMGAYVAPLVADRVPVRLLVLVNPMIPARGESAGQWWEATGHDAARAQAGSGPLEAPRDFFHDVSSEIPATAVTWPQRPPCERSFAEPWPGTGRPSTPTVVVQGRDDRLFPVAFVRELARERLGVEVAEVPGGHLLPLSRPDELARRLVALLDPPGPAARPAPPPAGDRRRGGRPERHRATRAAVATDLTAHRARHERAPGRSRLKMHLRQTLH